MGSILRLRKLLYLDPSSSIPSRSSHSPNAVKINCNGATDKVKLPKRVPRRWRCMDTCCWLIGYLCTAWWVLLLVYQWIPNGLIGVQVNGSPGERLRGEGVRALYPVVLVPGIVTGGLELWEGRPCAQGLFRKRLWGGSFAEIFKRPRCWLEHLSLDKETGLDPPGIRVRAVPGLVAADYFAPGYFVWAVLIENLAKIGYEEKNMHMAAYDWRLSFQNTEVRDNSLSRLKSKIELMYISNGKNKVVVVPHSMGVNYFLHFLKWVESPPPMGGGGGTGWCAKHIKAVINIGPAFLGVPKTVSNMLSAEAKDVAYLRSVAPGVFDSDIVRLQPFEHVMRMFRTWDSVISLLPKGGETIWGDLDWSPEENHECDFVMKHSQFALIESKANNSEAEKGFQLNEKAQYGRMISFGMAAAERPSSQLPKVSFEEGFSLGHSQVKPQTPCGDTWTEYDELSREIIRDVGRNKAYTAETVVDLFRHLAPKTMQRAEAHFSHGIADDLDDPKYEHYKYWSNPLETKLPNAPDMEMYCLYGVGIPTERSYVYKISQLERCNSIPYQIDSAADGTRNKCLKKGIYFVDGDESVPVISAGFMCAKGWRGKTRFNPSGMATYVREYRHKPPTSLLEGRGAESGSHVDILGNVKLIEDVMRVAAGVSGEELGGDTVFSDIVRMSDRIELRL
ncbi:putative phospholipid:diacylglycerol acyltransferase 2 [Drosera capensis]